MAMLNNQMVFVYQCIYIYHTYHTRWCPSSLAKLVNITPISLGFMVDIPILNGGYKPTYNWGGTTLY